MDRQLTEFERRPAIGPGGFTVVPGDSDEIAREGFAWVWAKEQIELLIARGELPEDAPEAAVRVAMKEVDEDFALVVRLAIAADETCVEQIVPAPADPTSWTLMLRGVLYAVLLQIQESEQRFLVGNWLGSVALCHGESLAVSA